MLVIGTYTKSPTFLILIVTNSFDDEDIQALTFFLEFFAQYLLLFHIYNIDVTMMLPAKNIAVQSMVNNCCSPIVLLFCDPNGQWKMHLLKTRLKCNKKRIEWQNIETSIEGFNYGFGILL
jgi:hypothetical protein